MWNFSGLKNKLSIFIFTLYFKLFFVKIRCELSEIRGTERLLSTISAMTYNSRRHDVTSIEHNVDTLDVCLFETSLDYVFHTGKRLYLLMKRVAR